MINILKNNSDDPMEMKLSPMLAISVVFHLAIFSIFLFVPESFSHRPIEGVVYEVNLVEMPVKRDLRKTSSPNRRKGKALVKKDTKAKRIKSRKKVGKPIVISKRTIKKKTSLRKKTAPTKLIDRAISRIEKKVKSEKKDHIDSAISRAISRIEKKVKSEKKDHIDSAISRLEGKVNRLEGQTPTGRQSISGMPIRIYQMEVENWIKSNWAYPVALHSAKDRSSLEAIVVVMVRRNGSISKTEVLRRSSSIIFDQSVIKAIEKSDPLPPFPEGYKKSYEEFEIKFNLKELEG
ncbi:MAG: TonB family protein [Desulfatiglandales bacterium]|jgi:colicin import membrane protein|nr:TonB family protein [Desulfatiglandales bacterium]